MKGKHQIRRTKRAVADTKPSFDAIFVGEALAEWYQSRWTRVRKLSAGGAILGAVTEDVKTPPDEVPPNMRRLEAIVAELPEAERVDVAAWDDHPTFRVQGKNFVFADHTATHLTVKLSLDEAEAVTATDPAAAPAGYGLGRHGWVALTVDADADDDRWDQVSEWVRTSFALVAPRRLARLVAPTSPDAE